MKTKIKTALSAVAVLLATLLFSTTTFANQELPTPPDFPACLSYTDPGDYTHYDSGTHQIVGNGLVEGADDVYTFGDNYVQCFCSPEGEGIQTNWWRTDSILDGWFSENGLQWNLGDFSYLAQNIDYDCSEPEPTPTPTEPPRGGNGGNGGNGHYSCPATKPSTPTLDNVVRLSPTSVELIWTPVDNVTHYSISYGTEPGNHPYGVPDTGNVTAYVINDLNPNQTYYFTIRAVNDCEPSEASNEMSPISTGGQVLGASTTQLPAAGSMQNIIKTVTALTSAALVLFLVRRKKTTNSISL